MEWVTPHFKLQLDPSSSFNWNMRHIKISLWILIPRQFSLNTAQHALVMRTCTIIETYSDKVSNFWGYIPYQYSVTMDPRRYHTGDWILPHISMPALAKLSDAVRRASGLQSHEIVRDDQAIHIYCPKSIDQVFVPYYIGKRSILFAPFLQIRFCCLPLSIESRPS